MLVTTLPGETKPVPVPLKHTEVKARVDAYIATVDVQQQFHNPFDSKIEAVYVFPLPQDAAVNEFVMTIGDRKIRGIIREREEAEQIYEDARSQGYVASLLTQERPNIFTQKVANIEPGKRIDVNIKYFNALAYEDGWYEFVFPMVVGPRFNPAGYTDGVGAVGRGATSGGGASGQSTDVQYLKPNERSGHDIGLTLDIDAGVAIEAIRSVNHRIVETPIDETRVRVAIDKSDTLPNKDFVLRFQVAGETIKTNVLAHRDERGGFFSMVLYPPKELKHTERAPMEMIFVLDCSGSMSGKPIEQAKDAITHGLKQLKPYDTFQVIRFSNNASQFGKSPVPATPQMIRRATRYVNGLNGGGGTMMIEGIKAALDFPHEEGRLRFVSFMTDGYIGNDREIIGEVHHRIGESRIFSFGVGSSPNRYLMNRMAKEGRGVAAYLSLKDNGDEVMDKFFTRVSHPALTDIEINFGGAQVTDVYPRKIPDLFVGRPVVSHRAIHRRV
jgi:Ca-activated chloride channel family protein